MFTLACHPCENFCAAFDPGEGLGSSCAAKCGEDINYEDVPSCSDYETLGRQCAAGCAGKP